MRNRICLNRTIMELKWAFFAVRTANNAFKSYHYGIEILQGLLEILYYNV